MFQAFDKLTEREQQEIRNKIKGNTNKMVDPKKYKSFVDTVAFIKMFMKTHAVGKYEFDVDLKEGLIKIKFKEINFKWEQELKSMCKNIKAIILGLDEDGIITFNIEVDVTVKLGGRK